MTVHYVDEQGHVIKDPFTVGSDYADGSRYDTRDHKSDTFSYNGQTYEFKEIQSGVACGCNLCLQIANAANKPNTADEPNRSNDPDQADESNTTDNSNEPNKSNHSNGAD